LVHLNPKLEVERCANKQVSKAAERCETASPSVAGRGGHAIGATMDTISMSEKKQSRACHYSKRKRACGGEHSNANAHMGGWPCPGTTATRLALEKNAKWSTPL